ncbi:ABC transporter ATP-binding protein [Castellaniella sp.]|uniref:ABC transporter ATP-binding protein n=1 Tax=Castellaniella sp. TaxID=1955812 RepID=UPI002AFDE1E9|nr:ABC transporter ATP-binding protein [Castellaniella sp.]
MTQPIPSASIMRLVQGFWRHLSLRRKHQLSILMLLMVCSSFAEVLSLGAVLPFLGVLTTPDKVLHIALIQPVLHWLDIHTAEQLLLPVTSVFILAVLLAGGMRLLMLYVSTRLSFAISADFSYEVYRRTLYQPYLAHVSRNSSEIINGITNKVGLILSGLLMPLLTLISSVLMLGSILVALMAINPVMSLAAFLGFGVIYGVVMFVMKRRLAENSERVSLEGPRVIQALQEGLGGIRDVLIDGSQLSYCGAYRNADVPLRHAQASSLFIAGAPRFAAEALGIAFIAILAYVLAMQEGGVANAITTLGALALGAQRMLPLLQQGYQALVSIRSSQHSLGDALSLLGQPIDASVYQENATTTLSFERGIQLEGVGFRYAAEGANVLRDINLNLPCGHRIGFIGTTGSGKSTLLDVIMGLLPPTEGRILIDGVPLQSENLRVWQRRIAHVPQAIYLSDSSISENIAFGVPARKIDMTRVKKAARQAQICDYIESLPDGYSTHVGERGVRLSGGQRQRIGIARALYKQAQVIIFDEATSALDNDTERAIMDAIDSLDRNLTILMIAHRLSTLERCDQVIEIGKGRIVQITDYRNIIQN